MSVRVGSALVLILVLMVWLNGGSRVAAMSFAGIR